MNARRATWWDHDRGRCQGLARYGVQCRRRVNADAGPCCYLHAGQGVLLRQLDELRRRRSS